MATDEEQGKRIADSKEVRGEDIPFVLSKEHKMFYTSSVQFIGSTFDVRLVFGQTAFDPEKTQLSTVMEYTAVMSWEHAKALAFILLNNVREREAEYGPLHLHTKQQQEQLDKARTAPKQKADGNQSSSGKRNEE